MVQNELQRMHKELLKKSFEITTVCVIKQELYEINQLLHGYAESLQKVQEDMVNFDKNAIRKSMMGPKTSRNLEVSLLGRNSQENQYLIRR
jgi:hypothetical protein